MLESVCRLAIEEVDPGLAQPVGWALSDFRIR